MDPNHGYYKHHFRAIPVDKMCRTDKRDGLAVAVAVEYVMMSTVSVDRKSTRLNSSHSGESRMPSSA